MVKSTNQIIAELKVQFAPLQSDPRILAVILYGSVADGDHYWRSDIDVCVVTPRQDLHTMYKAVMQNIKGDFDDLDIRFFEELPLLIRGEIMEKGKIIFTQDMGELTEYFFFSTRRELDDFNYRMQYI